MPTVNEVVTALWPFLLLSLVVYGLALGIRRAAEGIYLKLKANHYWNEVVLPILPVALGFCLAAVVANYPYPPGMGDIGSRALFGVAAGLLSGLVYRVLKAVLYKLGWLEAGDLT